MKYLLIALLSACSIGLNAQTQKITQLLNKQFKKEQKMYDKFDDRKPTLTQPYIISNDSLIYEISFINTESEGGRRNIRSAVHLKDINALTKDINILFQTSKDAINVTNKTYDAQGVLTKEESGTTYLYFTELSKEKENEKFRNQLLKAFEKSGYPIISEFWYD